MHEPSRAQRRHRLAVGPALAAYQATLTTPAPFDRFLAGDGALLGGSTLQRFGLTREYAALTGSNPVDTGRFGQTQKEEDRYVFRVAMLRNIAKTAPYFHDGSVRRLDVAVRVMAELQLAQKLNAVQRR